MAAPVRHRASNEIEGEAVFRMVNISTDVSVLGEGSRLVVDG